jgi:DNA repair protein RecO (recombination protein O)
MSIEKSNAIVLRVTEFSETSCIGSFFTRDFGKLTLIAKGARRPKSPFEAALDVLAVCRIVFLHKSSAMGTLTEAKLERRFRNRRQNLHWFYAAFYVIELLRSLVEEGDPHPELFDLAIATIMAMDGSREMERRTAVCNDSERSANADSFELNACLLRFEVGLLKHLGHFPSLHQCVGCGRERRMNNLVTFGLNTGGVLCPKCRSSQTNLVQISSAGINCLTQLKQEIDGGENKVVGLSDSVRSQDISVLHETVTRYQKNNLMDEWSNDSSPSLDTPKGASPWGEIRMLMNQYLAMLIGHEPRAIRYLAKLSRLESG